MKKILVSFLFLGLAIIFCFSFIYETANASAFSIVPCGRNFGTAEEMAPCSLCHLAIGTQGLIQYGLYILAGLTLVIVVSAGIIYALSSGNENILNLAKKFLKNSLTGFAIILSAWLITNTVFWLLGTKTDLGIGVISWNQFTCSIDDSEGLNEPVKCAGEFPGLGGTCRFSSSGCSANEKNSEKNTDCPTDNVCCVPFRKCEMIAGNKEADFVYLLTRIQFGAAKDGFVIDDCKNSSPWNATSETELNAFKDLAGKMANGLNLLNSADRNNFAVYRLDEIFDGKNDNVLSEIMRTDCPNALKNRLLSYGYVYNGSGNHAKAFINSKKAYYCIKGDRYNNRAFAHEQIGHIFANFRDEYYPTKTCSDKVWINITENDQCEKWKNISSECVEQCNCYSDNCFRSSENSIMRNPWEPDGIFNDLQNYVIDSCNNNFSADCPPSILIEPGLSN